MESYGKEMHFEFRLMTKLVDTRLDHFYFESVRRSRACLKQFGAIICLFIA
jgi:hypothetical protein